MARGSILSFILLVISVGAIPAAEDPPVDALAYAKGAAEWILSVSKVQDQIRTWPVNQTDRNVPTFDLYYGMPGGILLLAELAKEDPAGPWAEALPQAVSGLESLRVSAGDTGDTKVWGARVGEGFSLPGGLYSGVSGVVWLYLELYRVTGQPVYREKARAAVAQVLVRPKLFTGAEIWNNSTDIISGAAGIGLVLLRAAADLQDDRCTIMARAAGDFLLAQAIATPSGLKWKINAAAPTVYPNFAHGTAGVSYFLARLAEDTQDKRYLSAASRGALELQALADIDEKRNNCIWYHHEGDGEDLYYAGWCHGPAGTARLFYELEKVDRSGRAKIWLDRSANWLLTSGIPDPPKPVKGYWNEGICCGTAGIGDFMIDLSACTGKKSWLTQAGKMATHLAKAAEKAETGYRWVQSENRVPVKSDAQTGYAQGAAGIGLFFLKLSRAQHGVAGGLRFPDSPF